jgi:hypothetical protein
LRKIIWDLGKNYPFREKKSPAENFAATAQKPADKFACMKATKPQPATTTCERPRRARRKPKPTVYGAAWGRWIKSNVVRDLRSGALRVNASGETIH